MKDEHKTKKQLINKLLELRQRIAELEKSEKEPNQVEETLRESEARYRALFDRTLYCVYLHDLEGKFLDANEAALNLLGYKKEDIPFLSFPSILDEDQLSVAFKNTEDIKQTGSFRFSI